MMKKGILLAGGSGTRLAPLSLAVCKQILPIYDKPMIYYPLSTLLLAGIQDICLISTPKDLPLFKQMLGTGESFGVKFTYLEQDKPRGIADAFRVARDFVAGESMCLVLGDNIFFGHQLPKLLERAAARTSGATIFGYQVGDPESFGVVEFDKNSGKAISIEEKPKNPKSKYAVVGLYFYDHHVTEYAEKLRPSTRGELEITDLNRMYMEHSALTVETMGRGMAWLDTGSFESLLQASNFVQTIEKRQGLKISCPEEIAWRKGFISTSQLKDLALKYRSSGYGDYLSKLLEE